MDKLTEEQISKAVEWWADRVASPTFRTLSDAERADPETVPVAIAEVLAHALVENVTQDQREKFISALSEELKSENYNPWNGLYVDYDPDMVLRSAADKAGISSHNFPWKTGMWFKDGDVFASLGYGGERKKL